MSKYNFPVFIAGKKSWRAQEALEKGLQMLDCLQRVNQEEPTDLLFPEVNIFCSSLAACLGEGLWFTRGLGQGPQGPSGGRPSVPLIMVLRPRPAAPGAPGARLQLPALLTAACRQAAPGAL